MESSKSAVRPDALRNARHIGLVIDVHPPTSRDPLGMHVRFRRDSFGEEKVPGVTEQQPLGTAAYRSGQVPTAYFQPLAVGDELIDMPAFLTPDLYVNVPLEAKYLEAWRGVPRHWKQVIEGYS